MKAWFVDTGAQKSVFVFGDTIQIFMAFFLFFLQWYSEAVESAFIQQQNLFQTVLQQLNLSYW